MAEIISDGGQSRAGHGLVALPVLIEDGNRRDGAWDLSHGARCLTTDASLLPTIPLQWQAKETRENRQAAIRARDAERVSRWRQRAEFAAQNRAAKAAAQAAQAQ